MEQFSLNGKKVPLILSHTLESKRIWIENQVINADKRIKTFAKKYGWLELTTESFIDKIEIHDSTDNLKKSIIHALKLAENESFPSTLSAVLEQKTLFAVSEDVYFKIYPDGVEPNAYEKLIAHEIAHRLHVRILHGDEAAMGPVWFFEGFALTAATQFENDSLTLSPSEIRKIIDNPVLGSYKKYAALMRFLLAKHPVNLLIERAKEKNFNEWLKNEYKL